MIKDAILPIAVVAIVASMLLPMPAMLLDFLLVSNILLAIILVACALFINEPLKLSSLPSILLFATLFRLGLNVSTTRMILSRGEAGETIAAFGEVVVQGSLVVGLVVFLVISLIQFIVIAKGAERVAEVSARFTLDAMPGKQMSIDADMRAGVLDFNTARQRREDLQVESRFYASLDGAMKFVKGDAIAGLIIIAVNGIGGLIVGMISHGMPFSLALQRYTLLTVGDGLASQIPAFLQAVAAGFVITRVARENGGSLSGEVISQLGQIKSVRLIAGLAALSLACAPGMPALPLVLLGLALLFSTLISTNPASSQQVEASFKPKLASLITICPTSSFAEAVGGSKVFHQEIEAWRAECLEKIGIILLYPDVEILTGENKSCAVKLRNTEILRLNFDASEQDLVLKFRQALYEFSKSKSLELIDDTMVRRMLDTFEAQIPELVNSVVPAVLPLTQLTILLKSLLKEDVNIRSLDVILQAVAEHGPRSTSERSLTQEVRLALRDQIISNYKDQNQALHALTLEPMVDLRLLQVESGSEMLSGQAINELVEEIREKLSHEQNREQVVILSSKSARRLVREILIMHGVDNAVLAHEEIVEGTEIINCGFVGPKEGFDDRIERQALAA